MNERRTDALARHCARPIRGCATDEQYRDVVCRITESIGAARLAARAQMRDACLAIVRPLGTYSQLPEMQAILALRLDLVRLIASIPLNEEPT